MSSKKLQIAIKKLWCIRNINIILYNDYYDDNLSLYDYNVEKSHFESRFK